MNCGRQLFFAARLDRLKLLANSLSNRLRRLVAATDCCMERLEICVIEFRRDFVENSRLADLLHRKTFTAEGLDEIVVAILDCVFASFSRMPSLDLVCGLVGNHKAQPVLRGTTAFDLRRKDLDRITRLKLCVESNQTPIHTGTDTGVTHIGVDRVGEIDSGGSQRKCDHLALRGEDEDFVLLKINLEIGHEL